jgi:hypothetical protein
MFTTRLSCYFSKNVVFKEPIYLCVVFIPRPFGKKIPTATAANRCIFPFVGDKAHLGDHLIERKTSLESLVPSFTGKVSMCYFTDNDEKPVKAYMVTLRTWVGNTDKLTFKFGAKFGPFDTIYRAAGAYEKKYLPNEN